jgi:hypothetical protein
MIKWFLSLLLLMTFTGFMSIYLSMGEITFKPTKSIFTVSMLLHICNLTHEPEAGGMGVPDQLGQNPDPVSKTKCKQKGWGHGSSCRVLA